MDARQHPEHIDTIVIGGGLAGLSAAVGLSQNGLKVLVLEGDSSLGGRASSWADPQTGDTVHNGPHVLVSCYDNMLKFLDVLGTADQVAWSSPGDFITLVEGQQRFRYKSSLLPPPFHFVPSILADERWSLADLASHRRVLLDALRASEDFVLELDQISALEYLCSRGVTKKAIEGYWSFSSMAVMNVPLSVCSAGALMRFYRRVVGKGNFAFGFPKVGLGDLYAPAAKSFIEGRGGRVLTNAKVTELRLEDDRVVGVTLQDGRKHDASHCVAAVPPHVLKKIVPSQWRSDAPFNTLDQFEPCPYISVYLWFDDKLTDLSFWARTYSPSDLNLDFYDLSNIYEGWSDRPSLIASNIIYSDRVNHLSDQEIIDGTLEELREFLPNASRAQLRSASVHRIPMAIHCPRPGTERCRPTTRSPKKGLLLAGDWVKTELPSSMESAVKSGWLAAEEVLASTGRSAQLAIHAEHLDGLAKVIGALGPRQVHGGGRKAAGSGTTQAA